MGADGTVFLEIRILNVTRKYECYCVATLPKMPELGTEKKQNIKIYLRSGKRATWQQIPELK